MRAAVVFDLGGVVVEWNPRRLFLDVLGDAERVETFIREADFFGWNNLLDAGAPFDATLDEWRTATPRWAAVIDAFAQRWSETIGPTMAATVAVVEELLDMKVACFALSNWSPDTFPLTAPLLADLLARFDGVLLSGEIGVCKPDPAIFREAERRFELDLSNMLFVDDSAGNVKAATALGWRSHHFQGAAALRAALVRGGILAS